MYFLSHIESNVLIFYFAAICAAPVDGENQVATTSDPDAVDDAICVVWGFVCVF